MVQFPLGWKGSFGKNFGERTMAKQYSLEWKLTLRDEATNAEATVFGGWEEIPESQLQAPNVYEGLQRSITAGLDLAKKMIEGEKNDNPNG
jgi:hypothetical protein